MFWLEYYGSDGGWRLCITIQIRTIHKSFLGKNLWFAFNNEDHNSDYSGCQPNNHYFIDGWRKRTIWGLIFEG